MMRASPKDFRDPATKDTDCYQRRARGDGTIAPQQRPNEYNSPKTSDPKTINKEQRMKSLKPRLLLAAALAAASLGPASSAQAAVAVSIGEPGFYGSIDIGGAPPPALIYERPVVAGPPVVVPYGAPPPPPLYLRVPVGYERNWGRYCGYYRACGRPVYFVQDRWYREQYVPHWHHMHGPPPRYDHREYERDRDRDRWDHDHHH